MTPELLLAFDDEWPLAQALAAALALPLKRIERHRFPDGELKLTLPASLPSSVLLLRGLHQPNHKLVELLIAAPAARELGVRQLMLVSPYLAYMRQDIAFSPGEAVSQRHIAGLLARHVDALVTIDPHLHRIHSLDEVMPGCRTRSITAARALGDWVRRHVDGPLLLGPDEESLQWVGEAGRAFGLPYGICTKQRLGDRDVRVTLPALPVAGRAVVLIDDLVSTGRTLIEAAGACLNAGAASVDVAVTHGLFVGDAFEQLRSCGVRHVWASDAVPHPSAVIPVAPLLADAVRSLAQPQATPG